MPKLISDRIKRLENRTGSDVEKPDVILVGAPGEPPGFLMRHQPDGTWKHEDLTSKPTGGNSF